MLINGRLLAWFPLAPYLLLDVPALARVGREVHVLLGRHGLAVASAPGTPKVLEQGPSPGRGCQKLEEDHEEKKPLHGPARQEGTHGVVFVLCCVCEWDRALGACFCKILDQASMASPMCCCWQHPSSIGSIVIVQARGYGPCQISQSPLIIKV